MKLLILMLVQVCVSLLIKCRTLTLKVLRWVMNGYLNIQLLPLLKTLFVEFYRMSAKFLVRQLVTNFKKSRVMRYRRRRRRVRRIRRYRAGRGGIRM